jgi:hypothetical protein
LEAETSVYELLTAITDWAKTVRFSLYYWANEITEDVMSDI